MDLGKGTLQGNSKMSEDEEFHQRAKVWYRLSQQCGCLMSRQKKAECILAQLCPENASERGDAKKLTTGSGRSGWTASLCLASLLRATFSSNTKRRKRNKKRKGDDGLFRGRKAKSRDSEFFGSSSTRMLRRQLPAPLQHCTHRAMSTFELMSTRQELLRQLHELERKLGFVSSSSSASSPSLTPPLSDPTKPIKANRERKKPRQLDFSRYGRRKIALRFCYDGWDYCGLALQPGESTPLPTVEGVLLAALERARLIPSAEDWEEFEYSRSGRTDRGVSAAGQVVSLWVRSALDKEELERENVGEPLFATSGDIVDSRQPGPAPALSKEAEENELRYVQQINRLLPPSIRVLAWSPVSPSFDARFSCLSRHYKYFFSTAPTGLDVDLMRDAASRLVGEHDFRNMCKIDPSKQITNFHRRILSATIDPVDQDSTDGDLYVLNLVGTAFLYHQVRHIMAVLFLVGAGHESPSIIDALFNVDGDDGCCSSSSSLPIIRSKPAYAMAEDLPLVLWGCSYPADSLSWRVPVEHKQAVSMHSHWTLHRIRSAITRHFLDSLGVVPSAQGDVLQHGAGKLTVARKYKALVDRQRAEEPEVVNEKWRTGKGARRLLAEKAEEQEDMEE
jgi:tRNA pseudouridine38/39 synthase